MATKKKVSLDIAIDGEAEYKQALQSLNSQLKTLGTESKKLSAIYAEDANSYDALVAKSKLLAAQQSELAEKTEKLRNAVKAAQDAQTKWGERKSALSAKLEELKNKTASTAEEQEKLNKKMAAAESTLARHAENIEYAARREQTYTQQLNLAEAELATLNREIDKNNTYLQEAATSADGTAHSIDKYGNEVKGAAEDTKSFANAADLLAQAIVASGAVEGAEKLRDAIVDTAEASIEYESAFAGVRKTVDGTAEELAAISDGIKGVATEIPIATTELAGIAEAAGQLGIETGNILKFTDVTAKLAATTDLSANDAAVSISKLGNITKLTADEYSNFGSALVALGNNTSAFESEILAMAIRLASAGDIVGATNSQLLGIASTLVSVGVEAEAGGTAFSKLLRQIEVAVQTGSKKVQEYATVAGMSAEEFSSAWKNDAVGAVTAFIEGLGSLESKGQSSIVVLNEMGLTEQRLLDTISRLSEAEGMLSNNIALSNTAWEENTALANEAAIRFETTESKLQILNNTFNNLKITVGDELLDKFGGAIDGLTDLTQAADEYVKKNPDVVAGITAVAAGLGSLAVAGTVIPLITTLWGLLSANPAGLAATAIIGLITALVTFAATTADTNETLDELQQKYEKAAEKSEKLDEANKKLAESFSESMAAVDEENEKLSGAVDTLESLSKKTELTITEQRQLDGAIKTLNSSIPGLSLDFRNLSSDIDTVVESLRTMIKVMNMQSEAEAIDKNIQAIESANKNLVASQTSTNELLKQAQEERARIYKELQEKEEGKNFWNTTIGEKLEIEGLKNDLAEADKLIIQYKTDLARLDSQIEENDYSIDLKQNEYDNILSEIDEFTNEYEDALGDLDITTKDTGEAVANAFDKFMSSIGESGKKSVSALADYGEAFKAGFSVPFLTAINETASNSDEVLGAMMTRYRELVTTYGEGSEEVKAFVTGVNTTFAESAGAEDALVEGLKEYGIVVEETGKKAVTSTKATKEAIDEAGKAIITHADTVKKNLETLTKEYDSVYKSAQSSLGGIGGLFGEVAFKTDKSISDMLSGLDSQANYFTGYMLNLQRASQIGIDEGLVAALADGSDESAGYLQKIIDEFNKVVLEFGEGSPEAEAFVKDFNTKFEATSKAKDALAATMAGIQTNFEERAGDILAQADDLITELSGYSGNAYDEVSKAVSETLTDIADGFTKFQVAAQEKSQGIIDAANYIKTGINTTLEVLPEEMKVAGQNVSLGLSEGILDKAGVLEDTVRRLAKEAIIGAAKDELGIRSPSKEGEQIGKFFDEGIAQGIERNESTVISANLKMISDLESASQSAAAAAGKSLGDTMVKSMTDALKAGQALRQAAESGNLTVNGNKVQTAAQAGIPSLSGQAAEDWLNEVKAMFGLPDSYTRQDAVDFLNGGGAMLGSSSGGLSSSTQANIESAVKNERTSQNSITRVKVGNRYINISDPGGLRSSYGIGGGTVNYGNRPIVVNQTFNGDNSEAKAAREFENTGVKLAYF